MKPTHMTKSDNQAPIRLTAYKLSASHRLTAYLVGSAVEYCVEEGEGGNAAAQTVESRTITREDAALLVQMAQFGTYR